MATENVHAPAARGCARCHKPHFSDQDALLVEAVQPLCTECHSPQTGSFGRAHLNLEVSVMRCQSCHDPHASKDPKFFKATTHAPFAARACDECHIP
jgi:predicted CXXCH cytochrome family protein